MTSEKITLRFRYITPVVSITTLVTLVGICYAVSVKINKYDQAVEQSSANAIRVSEHDIQLAVVNSKLDIIASNLKEISREIHRQGERR